MAFFCIGMRQFLLLPNSTMTVSSVMSMITKFSPAALLQACTAAKAPAFFYACPAVPAGGALPKDPTHAGMFCVKFEEICRAKGIRCEKAPREAIIKALLD